jgi:oxygen-independent coproporphyrinogen-3 oxidase
MDDYLTALAAEMGAILERPRRVETIFIGGGTPTYLSAQQLERLLTIVAERFDLESVVENTVESNPNTLDAEKVAVLAEGGVNRVSLGAQSFQPHLLARLERNHDPASVPRAVDLVRRRIENVSLDLIFGVPGQSLDEWKRDLEEVISLGTLHCSAYGLTYEKGTRLWRQQRLGVVQKLDEETERAMYEHAIDRLGEAGFTQYEVSNSARRD